MKRWLFPGLLLALWATVIVIFMTPEVPGGRTGPHRSIEKMDQGGDGLERHRAVFVSGWIFGTILIAAFVSLLAWGTVGPAFDPGERLESSRFHARDGFFLLGGLVLEAVFSLMCLAYYRSVSGTEPVAFLGPFPTGTALLLFGMWLTPGVFIAAFVVRFQRWIVPPANLEKFRQLVDRSSHEG